MATVLELSAPYENHLLPVLPPGAGVCRICRTVVVGGYPECFQCGKHREILGSLADAVAFVALAVKGEQLARDLWVYKSRYAESARRRPVFGLAAVLWRWLSIHEPCLAAAAGVPEFPVVTTVPSKSGRATHPLETMVSSSIGATSLRYAGLLQFGQGGVYAPREAHPQMFQFAGQTVPPAVLVIDDTWTSGASGQSAAHALKTAGVRDVGLLTIGRHFTRSPDNEAFRPASEQYYQAARQQRWNWQACSLCASPPHGEG